MGNALDESAIGLAFQWTTYVRYTEVACMVWLVCEHFQLFDLEVEHIWHQKWTFIKILYFLAHYSPFVDLTLKILVLTLREPDARTCLILFNVETYVTTIGLTSAEVFFCIRALALWGFTRGAYIFCSGLGALTSIAGITLSVLTSYSIRNAFSSVPGTSGCMITQTSAAMTIFPTVASVYTVILDTTLIVMVLIARRKRYNACNTPIVKKIFRDAVVYYNFQLAIHLFQIILWFTLPGPLKDIASSVPRVGMSVITSRVILHIRKLGAKAGYMGTLLSERPISMINFRRTEQDFRTV